jgi:hypothetical protein
LEEAAAVPTRALQRRKPRRLMEAVSSFFLRRSAVMAALLRKVLLPSPGIPLAAAMGVASQIPVAGEGDPRSGGEPCELVPRGAGEPEAMPGAKPKRGILPESGEEPISST